MVRVPKVRQSKARGKKLADICTKQSATTCHKARSWLLLVIICRAPILLTPSSSCTNIVLKIILALHERKMQILRPKITHAPPT